jgi:prefoldin subunit 5
MTDITGETYTHRSWLDWAHNCSQTLEELHEQLDQMAHQIEDDNGDQAQADAIRQWQAEIETCVASGVAMVEEVNATQLPVGEAVAAAGGSDNTPHKQYADEARTR